MKKTIILTLIGLIFITGSVLAFEDFTGNDWNELSKREKQIFLRGLQEGMNITNFVWIEDVVGFKSFDKTYNYMKENDNRLNLGKERILLLDDIFDNNPDISYLKMMADEYVSNIEEKSFEDKKNNFSNGNVKFVGYDTKMFAEFEGTPPNRHSRLILNFKNNSNKILNGLIYEMKLYDNFGDLIGQNINKSQIKLNPKNEGIEYFNFYPNMNQTIYNLIKNNTLKVEINLQKAVFEDGSIVEFKGKE